VTDVSATDRVQVQFRLERSLRDRLYTEADTRDVSINLLLNRAIEDFLGRLKPVEEAIWLDSTTD